MTRIARAAAALVVIMTAVGAAAPALASGVPRLVDRALDAGWPHVLDRPLAVESADRGARAELSGLFDLEGYVIDRRPPGLIFGGDDPFVNPRLSLFLDTHLGDRWYGFVEARLDRGFDPRARASSFRFDQYLLRFAPLGGGRLALQAGKFATLVGNWVARHDSWNNPLVNAPLPYENVTIVSDVRAAPSRDGFLARRHVADRKHEWLPIVWGPSYASGAAVFGRAGSVEYGVEVKNAALADRPEVWDVRARDFAHPTISGRIGWRPGAAWSVGVSASRGAYLREKSAATLAAGHHVGDYDERVVAADATYAWRHVQLWAETFAARFDVPRVGAADTLAYYVEGRVKLTPRLFAALRWNQQLFDTVDNDAGDARAWDRDAWRVDVALGCRLSRHVQAKVQYSYLHQRGDLQQGEQLGVAQVTLKF